MYLTIYFVFKRSLSICYIIYYTATFLVGAHRFGIPFPKLQTYPGIIWTLHFDYSQYKKNNTRNSCLFVYLWSYNDKSKFLILEKV